MSFKTGALLRQLSAAVRTVKTGEIDLTGGDVAGVMDIQNGPILAHFLALEVIEAVSADAALLHLEVTPDAGSATDICEGTAGPDIASAAVGDFFHINGDSQDVMKKAATGTDLPMMENQNGGIIIPEGSVTLKLSTSDPTTGKGRLWMVYTPLLPEVFVDYSGLS